MDINVIVQADEKLLQVLNNLSNYLKLLAGTDQQQAPTPAAAPTPAPTPAPTTAPTSAPTAPPTPEPVPTPVPTSVPQYDFNRLAAATMQLLQAGYNVSEIFNQFSIQALVELPKERYAEYAAALRERGAKI